MTYKSLLLGVLAAFSVTTLAHAAADNVPRIKFKAETPLKLPPDVQFGEVPGVAVNSKGHVFVANRGGVTGVAYAPTMTQVFEFDQNGKYVREIGKGLYGFVYPHLVRFDKDDNLWVIDKGSNMVIQFNPEGRVMNVFGRIPEATEYRTLTPINLPEDQSAPRAYPGLFNQQTDVAWDSKGNFYITDGYQNSRVVKYSKEGGWVKTWGERGTGPSQFMEPHELVIDGNDNIYVGDRGNARVQVFNTDGKFLRQFTLAGQVPVLPGGEPPAEMHPDVPHAYPDERPWGRGPAGLQGVTGAPMAMCITPPGPRQMIYIADGRSRIYRTSLDGKLLGIVGEVGRKVGEFRNIHELTCPDDKTIWAADMFMWRVQKITVSE